MPAASCSPAAHVALAIGSPIYSNPRHHSNCRHHADQAFTTRSSPQVTPTEPDARSAQSRRYTTRCMPRTTTSQLSQRAHAYLPGMGRLRWASTGSIERCDATNDFVRSETSVGDTASVELIDLGWRRLVRANGAHAVPEQHRYDFSCVPCTRSGVRGGRKFVLAARTVRLNGVTARHDGAEETRECGTPMVRTSLEHDADWMNTRKWPATA